MRPQLYGTILVLVASSAAGAHDVVIYGGTASGVAAAIQASRMGKSAIVIEPSQHLGGLTSGGLGFTDSGNKAVVGGIAREFYQRVKKHYDDPKSWIHGAAEDYKPYRKNEDAMWTFEPKVAERILRAMLAEAKVEAVYGERLDRAAGVKKVGAKIVSIAMESGKTYDGKVFVDATYEGDLMAAAGVSSATGRESNAVYGESLNGVARKWNTGGHRFLVDVDPYVKPGDPKSGLLPLLQDIQPGPEGSADKLTMGYGFRWKFSKNADRLPIDPPDDYDPRTFELYRRGFQANAGIEIGRNMRALGQFEPEGGNIHNFGSGNLARALWAPTNYGSNADFPDSDYATRARIWKEQQNFMRGITHFIRTDPVVPEKYKKLGLSIGFQSGIFDETQGFPHQLYVREARRMKSAYVVTQKNLAAGTDVDDSVGLASYGVDEWPYATYPLNGKVALQGGYYSMLYLEEARRGIYKIPYRAITPKQDECTNLLVPVCVSASHIAMTSIRMEPVWMILGESAGVAASMAVKSKVPVQQVEYAGLRTKLLNLKQKLERPV